ncbi:MAG: class I SAM-dependent rRNA methyltransferase [Gemmatimonadetes bacterium]|nr:class I SAM-dependent rRNA methyltransferase [Gemmatimonadota bacterium]
MDHRGGDRLRGASRERDGGAPALHERPPLEVPTVTVAPAGARRALRRHPWIYRSDVREVPEKLENGAVVRVVDERGRPLGRAGWSARSKISLRFFRWEDEPVDRAFWEARLEDALERRRACGSTGPARRVVFAEGDEWPGFVVDQYGDSLAVQTLTPAAERLAPRWVEVLVERLGSRSVVARNDLKVRELEGLPRGIETWHGDPPPEPFPVVIGDHEFVVDLVGGQKTGAYLDQQENYRAAARWAATAPEPRRALDVFAGEGGFALHLSATVESVEAVETSAEAVARGVANAARNGVTNVVWTTANGFDRLNELDVEGARFDLVVLDPPAFAKNRKSVPGARRGYKEINLRALKILSPGGILVTCSCSYHLDRAMLLEIVADAAGDVGKTVELLEIRTQAADHPILVNVPETEYLKCLVMRVR